MEIRPMSACRGDTAGRQAGRQAGSGGPARRTALSRAPSAGALATVRLELLDSAETNVSRLAKGVF